MDSTLWLLVVALVQMQKEQAALFFGFCSSCLQVSALLGFLS